MLSILVPGIRNYLWNDLYTNFEQSLQDEVFEIIFVGPNPPLSLDKGNVKYVCDYGNMIRCQQVALLEAEGLDIHWCSDDCEPLPNMMKEALTAYRGLADKEILMIKYTESDNPSPDMWTDEYYHMYGYPGTRASQIPRHFFGLNMGIAKRTDLEYLGGWDARYKSCIGHFDLAVRAQFAGYKVIPFPEIVQHVAHTPGVTGDHGPMYYAQTQEDEPLFQKTYSDPECKNNWWLDLENWRLAPAKWEKRFG